MNLYSVICILMIQLLKYGAKMSPTNCKFSLDETICEYTSLTETSNGIPSNITHLTLPFDLFIHPSGMFKSLISLRILCFSSNQITAIPANTFSLLTSLTELYLNNTKLSSLQSETFNSLTSLKTLDLSHNQLSNLSPNLFKPLTSLTTLRLSFNQLTSLPSGIFKYLILLKELYLSYNQISSIPIGIFKSSTLLTILDFYSNSISILPSGVFKPLTLLRELILSFNKISSLQSDMFDSITSLTVLYLNGNQISSLPLNIFSSSTLLSFLDLGDNQISSLPPDIFISLTSLRLLDLQHNQIASLPHDVFNSTTSLNVLNLENNPLNCDCNLAAASKLMQARTVRISGKCFDNKTRSFIALGQLIDTDMCNLLLNNCSTNANFVYSNGSYNCICKNGYQTRFGDIETLTEVCKEPCVYEKCSHMCNSWFAVAICSCPIGMILDLTGKNCYQDPCYNYGCSHTCSSVSGTASCSCPVGMKLQSNGKKCSTDPCYYKGCAHLCTQVSMFAVCSCLVGYKLQSDGKDCLYDLCIYSGCSHICQIKSGSAICSCPHGMMLLSSGKICIAGSQMVTAVFDISSSQISKDVAKIMLTSYFNDYCSNYPCCYVNSNERISCAFKQLNMSTYIFAQSTQNKRLTLSFFIINFIFGEEVVAKETIVAALSNGKTFKYKSESMTIGSDGMLNNAKNDVKSTNASLPIIFACSFSGLLIIVVAIIFFVRHKKRAIIQNSTERELALAHEIDSDCQLELNNLGDINEPPPPYETSSLAASYQIDRNEAPPNYSL